MNGMHLAEVLRTLQGYVMLLTDSIIAYYQSLTPYKSYCCIFAGTIIQSPLFYINYPLTKSDIFDIRYPQGSL